MSPTLTGVPHTISYLIDPAVGFGDFRLSNPGTDPVEVRVVEASLHLADTETRLYKVFIFDRVHGIARDEVPLVLAPGETLDFSLSFAPVAYTSHHMSPVVVSLAMLVGADMLEARCAITMVRRIPKR